MLLLFSIRNYKNYNLYIFVRKLSNIMDTNFYIENNLHAHTVLWIILIISVICCTLTIVFGNHKTQVTGNDGKIEMVANKDRCEKVPIFEDLIILFTISTIVCLGTLGGFYMSEKNPSIHSDDIRESLQRDYGVSEVFDIDFSGGMDRVYPGSNNTVNINMLKINDKTYSDCKINIQEYTSDDHIIDGKKYYVAPFTMTCNDTSKGNTRIFMNDVLTAQEAIHKKENYPINE